MNCSPVLLINHDCVTNNTQKNFVFSILYLQLLITYCEKMTEFWLISAPGDKTCQQTWDKLNNVTARQNSLSTNYKFSIPDLKVCVYIWLLFDSVMKVLYIKEYI